MAQKYSLQELDVVHAKDLCALDETPPPLSFKKDLMLSEPPPALTYHAPNVDAATYWQHEGLHP